jgi:hypothetical protein
MVALSLPTGSDSNSLQGRGLVPTEESIRLTMHELAANFPTKIDLDVTLGSVTAAAVKLMDGVDYADVMLIRDGQARSIKPTVPLLTELDDLQCDFSKVHAWLQQSPTPWSVAQI